MANQPTTTKTPREEEAVPAEPSLAVREGGMGPPLVARPGNPRWRQFRRVARRLFLLVVLGMALIVFHRPLLTGYARLFEVNDPAPSDVIVLLLGDLRHRPVHAAKLYREGLAPRIVLSTLDEVYGGEEETAKTVGRLTRLGVPREAITVLPDRVESTRGEAQAVRKQVRRSGWKEITVLSSDFHTRRARWIFQRELAGMGVTVHMAAAHDPEHNAGNWWHNDEGLVRYVDETLKTLYYWLRY